MVQCEADEAVVEAVVEALREGGEALETVDGEVDVGSVEGVVVVPVLGEEELEEAIRTSQGLVASAVEEAEVVWLKVYSGRLAYGALCGNCIYNIFAYADCTQNLKNQAPC